MKFFVARWSPGIKSSRGIRFQMAAAFPVAPTTGVTVKRKTDSLVGQNVAGRDNDESRIVKMLLSSSQDVVSVIPIVGMGGLGKTTLAKLVYNNQKINGHFTKKIWVCVSENFDVMGLFRLILESLTSTKVELENRDTVVQKIRKQLEGERYLLVLDDVWNENPELWEDFFRSLVGLNAANGTWCLVTTRLLKVASIVTSNPPYVLGKLSDNDCWNILIEKAIAGEKVPEELNSMRKEIVKRCCGLPLSSNVIGGLLRIKKKEEWQSILENWLLNKSGDTNSIEQILKLSFDHLPSPSIKKCFAYCSTFAKDAKLDRDQLIKLWMAEGFLQPDLRTETTMEEIGENYCRILLESSLLEERKDKWEVSYYTMHDLVHDLAISVSKSDSINLESGVTDTNYQVRYLELNSSTYEPLKLFENRSMPVRAMSLQSSISGDLLRKFKNLHILKLSGAGIRELPTAIGKLIHLRFIDISYSSTIQTLPESFCKLYNLQTLRILNCSGLKALPKGMGNLISLRHLHYDGYDANFQMPPEMGQLTCLQTLEFFTVGLDKGYQMEELGCLNDLKGKLAIRNLELVKDKEGADKANLIGKSHLFELKFLWSNTNREIDNCDEEVLEGLQPHPNLQNLYITNFMGDQFPHWFMNLSTRLHKLVRLSLSGCRRCRELPVALGQLPSLQYLEFMQLENIRSIGLSFYEMSDNYSSSNSSKVSRKLFPALETLYLKDMKNLVEWIGTEADVFPKLEKLSIRDCSQLTSAPSYFPSLKELEIWKNDNVSAVKSILSKATRTLWKLTIIGMAGLTCVSDIVAAPTQDNNYGTLPNLKDLRLWNCPNLTSTRGCGTCLQTLYLNDCHSLKEWPGDMSGLRFLKILEIESCSKIVINPKEMQNLTSLEWLIIRGCDGLTYLPGDVLNSCTSLRSLKVYSCPNLVSFSLDLKQRPSLSTLVLMDCPKLKTNMTPKGFGFLTNLRELEIGPFSDEGDSSIDEFDWPGLISSSTLRQLTLVGLPHIESLPDQLQYLTSLTWLDLRGFGGIEALPDWLGNLASLDRLFLKWCPKLLYLPSMDAMRRLTKLRCLLVFDCPLLKESCTPQSGPEWPKISHIPELWIY
ncbi:hypothetical protein ACH5RR_039801 [Cinchona calisaya]|uniref:NB-ARC domain-containing protein n=1 Tax=Cinchona calisaya TaxID=153742 RepID=A0ABD2Y0L5_9GENT